MLQLGVWVCGLVLLERGRVIGYDANVQWDKRRGILAVLIGIFPFSRDDLPSANMADRGSDGQCQCDCNCSRTWIRFLGVKNIVERLTPRAYGDARSCDFMLS